MSILAIKGHATRGSEVIGLLEMLGGKNVRNFDGITECFYYCIRCETSIGFQHALSLHTGVYCAFTLEQFLEKFPYKIGDKVNVYGENAASVIGMRWESDYIVYRVRLEKNGYETSKMAEELQPYTEQKEEPMEETINNLIEDISYNSKIVWNDKFPDKTEIVLGEDFEVFVEDGHCYIARKQPQYPKTCEECLRLLGKTMNSLDNIRGHKCDVLMRLQQLLICRDAYWKIAGDWKPDWKYESEIKYCIINTEGNITKCVQYTVNIILAFPTEEMRDAFYENFKELIEKCKELL